MSDTPTTVDLDLDAERPASFRLQGEVFRLRQLSYKAFARVDEAFMAALEDEPSANGDGPKPGDDEDADIALQNERWERQLDAFADFVEANIVDEDLPKWRAVREREAGGVQQRDVHTLRRWLWEAQTGRPLLSAEASSPGPGSSEASSKDESGSPVVVRPT